MTDSGTYHACRGQEKDPLDPPLASINRLDVDFLFPEHGLKDHDIIRGLMIEKGVHDTLQRTGTIDEVAPGRAETSRIQATPHAGIHLVNHFLEFTGFQLVVYDQGTGYARSGILRIHIQAGKQ